MEGRYWGVMMHTKVRSGSLAAAVAMILSLNVSAANAQASAQIELPAQPLAEAIRAIARQASVNILVDPRLVEGRMAPAVKAQASIDDALTILLQGTGLTPKFVDEKTITLVEKSVPGSQAPTAESVSLLRTKRSDRIQLADADRGQSSKAYAKSVEPSALEPQGSAGVHGRVQSSFSAKPSTVQLEEVIVTGSHIRGAENLSSPVIRFDRKDIEQSGYATTQQFMQTIPQNLNDTVDDGFSRFSQGSDIGAGAGMNLRGIGSGATLTLLNGRRLAPAGFGTYVDVSLIPLSALERVEVLTDGASALYGSDAIAGVVNFHLRKDFEGAETRVHYGTVTEGNHSEIGASQAIGFAWGSGHALASYDYYDRDVLHSSERKFSPFGRLDYFGVDLVPAQQREGVFVTASQTVSDRLEVATDFSWAKRDTSTTWSQLGLDNRVEAGGEQIGGALTATAELPGRWQLRTTASIDRSATSDVMTDTDNYRFAYKTVSRLWSADVAADGPVMRAPGGEVRLAAGGQFRREDYQDATRTPAANFDRDVSALYAEILVPWVGSSNRKWGVERLDFTFASRYEEYSDFGGTFNPKVGLAWSPVTELNLRGTWGTSFRAPFLRETHQLSSPFAYQNIFVDGGGYSTVVLTGGYTELEAEESTNWTAGFDWTPAPGISLSATYFDIDYENRITSPFPTGYDLFAVLQDPNMEFIVMRDPDPEYVQQLFTHPDFGCYCSTPVTTSEIRAIIDSRVTNIAAYRTRGLDFSVSYDLQSSLGAWSFGAGGTRLFDAYEQVVPGIPAVRASGIVNRPSELRVRGNVSLSRGKFSGSAFINYVDGYRDIRDPRNAGPGHRPTVASWTTVDLTLKYAFDLGAHGAAPQETSIALTATNLFDRDPPFVSNVYGMFFDGANANPLGRWIGVNLTARW